jgi:hypothetical protein
MRKSFMLLAMALCVAFGASAQSGEAWLKRLNSSLGERYAMNIAVAMGSEAPISGFFMVDGDGYYITLGMMEVYSDGKLRYEVNNERKEVVEDRVNLEACDLLTNPTRAFSFVPNEFYSEVTSTANERVVLLLTPKSEAMGVSSITLTLEERGSKVVPTTIAYDYDGDEVTIVLTAVDVANTKLHKWDKSAYRAYDIVSFL